MSDKIIIGLFLITGLLLLWHTIGIYGLIRKVEKGENK